MVSGGGQHSGWFYFCEGFRLAGTSGIRRFVLVPIMINILLLGGAFYWLFQRLEIWILALMSYAPGFLQWLDYLLWPLAVVMILLIFGYFFSTIASWIAAPFNGLLAEQLEARLTGEPPPPGGVLSVIKDVPRVMAREVCKFRWYLPRVFTLLVFSFIPLFGHILAAPLWFLFGGWMLAIQYCDYPFDNHKISFADMYRLLRQHRMRHLQFGVLVNLCTLIPLVNLVIIPVAVCGATAIWVDCYRGQFATRPPVNAEDRS